MISSLRMLLFMTLLTGVAYPLLITGIAHFVFPDKSQGSPVFQHDKLVGSSLLAQKFSGTQYFWPRPSAIDYNTLSSGGSNLGPISSDLQKTVCERQQKLQQAHPEHGQDIPPQDLLFASGSGLDPHISPEAAQYQAQRVAVARKITVQQVQSLIEKSTESRQLGILGEARVNVLTLNLELDQL